MATGPKKLCPTASQTEKGKLEAREQPTEFCFRFHKLHLMKTFNFSNCGYRINNKSIYTNPENFGLACVVVGRKDAPKGPHI